jgi:hypothetical protein
MRHCSSVRNFAAMPGMDEIHRNWIACCPEEYPVKKFVLQDDFFCHSAFRRERYPEIRY